MLQIAAIEPVSECAFMIRFSEPSSEALSQFIGEVTRSLFVRLEPYIINITPSFCCILVEYFPHRIQFEHITQLTNELIPDTIQPSNTVEQLVELPVYYDLSTGPDLKSYQDKGISIQDVVALHSSQIYSVGAIGFAPGFAFLTGLAPELQLARKAVPRLSVPKGSVAIAENQTAVYPADSPGGWNMIGNCPISLYDPTRQPMIPFSIGTKIKFYPIDKAEFLRLGGKTQKGWN